MAKVLDEVLDSFFEELAKTDSVNDQMLGRLRELFDSQATLKADDFVTVLKECTVEDAR